MSSSFGELCHTFTRELAPNLYKLLNWYVCGRIPDKGLKEALNFLMFLEENSREWETTTTYE